MRLIRWSVDHSRLVLSFYAALLVLCGLCLSLWIPTRLVPHLKSPLLAVVTRSPNAYPEEVERRLTTPVEDSLAQTPGLRAIRSQSMHGLSVVVLEFPYGVDTDQAAVSVLGRLPQLPAKPQVVPYDPLDIPVLRLGVRDPKRDLQSLRELLRRDVLWQLKQVPGVARVSLFGIRPQYEISLTNSTLTPASLRAALGNVTRATQLKDVLDEGAVARLVAGHDSPRYRCNGREAFELCIFQKADASSPATVLAVRRAVQRLVRQYPGLIIEEGYNNAHFVEIMQANVWQELILAIGLTGLVIYFFLGDLRGTLIALATVPSTLAATLVLFVPLGLSLNSSTLVGLLLALGRLVDDTIIDLHAVSRQRALGKSPREAAVDGCSEVRPAVISSTLVLGLAMLPLTWCGGLTQDMFVGIVWPYLIALAASLLVSLTLTPALAARAYRQVARRPRTDLEGGYRRWLEVCLRWRWLVLGLAMSACYLAWLLVPLIGSEMMPLSDTGQVYVELEAPAGTSSEETVRLAAQLEEIWRRQPELIGMSTEVGMEEEPGSLSGYDMGGPNLARMFVTLNDMQLRRRSLWQITDSVYTQALREIPGMRRLTLKEMGSDVMATAMAPVQLVLRGPDLTRLAWLAEQTRQLGAQMRGLHMVSTSNSVQRVTQNPYRAVPGPGELLMVTDEGYPVVLEETRPGPRWWLIEHENLQRSVSVSGFVRRGGPGSMKLSMDLQMSSQSQLPFPAGYSLEQRGDMTQMMDSFTRLLKGLAVGLVLVYGALWLQFGNWRLPLLIMAAIPLELSGVLLALLLAGQTFSSVSILGIVVLHGMDVTASILLLDAVVRARRAGLDPREAILEGAPQRLRPVLMTVGVTLAVMLPLAFFPRTGLDAYSPLATVIVGGLSVSALLTLAVIPVLYSFSQGGKLDPPSERPEVP